MSQNPFDQWLKNSVNRVDSNVDLDEDWNALSQRLNNDRPRRRFAFWIWPTIAGVVLLLAFLIWREYSESSPPVIALSDEDQIVENKTNNEKETEDASMTFSSVSKEDIGTTFDEFASSENNQIQILNTIKIPDRKIDVTTNKSLSEKENQKIIAFERSTDIRSNKNLIKNETLKRPLTDQVKNNTKTPVDNPNRETWNTTPLALRQAHMEDKNSSILTDHRTSVKKLPGIWSLRFSLSYGTFLSTYSAQVETPAISSFQNIENTKESVAVDLRIYRELGSGWQIGAGFRGRWRHISYAQDFVDTLTGSSAQQVIQIIEEFDGSVTSLQGPGSGQVVYQVQRDNHQSFFTLSMPVVIRKYWSLNRRLSLGAELGFAPELHTWRSGSSIVSNRKDLQLTELNDRYVSAFNANALAGIDMEWMMRSKTSIFGGMNYSRDLIGHESKFDDWSQRFDDFNLELGVRLKL